MPFGGENAESYYDDGLTASMRGQLDEAVRYFEKALQLDPSYLGARYQLGRCDMRMGQTSRALERFSQVLAEKPGHIAARIDMGHALVAAGRTAEARRQFEEVIAAEPQNSRGLFGIADVAFNEGDWASAVEWAKRSLAFSGPYFPALYLLGRAAKLAGDTVLAEKSIEQADELAGQSQELAENQPESYYLRGELNLARDKYSQALDCFRDAADRAEDGRIYSAYGENFTRLDMLAKQGICYQRLGETARAREMGERILQANPEHRLAQSLARPE